MSAYLEKHNKAYSTSSEKAYSTDANILGATHEAKDLEYLENSLHIVEPIMGAAFWKQEVNIEPEEVEVEFEQGLPKAINGKSFANTVDLLLEANQVGGRHGLGMSDQIENRVIEAKSRGIYEAPGMALLHICYERLLSATHNEQMLDLYFGQGRSLAKLLYQGRWYDPESLLIQDSLCRYIARPIAGKVRLCLRRGDDYSILQTKAENTAYHPEKLSMEKTKNAFTPLERSGALAIQDLGIEANRNLMQSFDSIRGRNVIRHNPRQ